MYTLLVVDDEQYAVDGILEAIDWPSVGVTFTYGVNSVREAKEEMQKHPADVIICDIEMAGENGLDFLKWVKDRGYSAKLIFLTAYARFEYAQESVGLGAAEFLIKPIDHELLKSTVRDVLEQYKEEAAVQKRAEEYEKIKKMWEEQLPEFRSRFWLELLERPGLSVEKDSIQEMLALYRIHLKEGRLSMILIHIEWSIITDEKEIWIRAHRINDLAKRILLLGEGEVITIDEEHCVVLFYNPANYDRGRLDQFTETLLQEVNCEVEYYVSENILYTEINYAYGQLKTTENKKSFSDKHFVFNLSEKNYGADPVFPSTEILNTYMETGKRDELKKVIGGFLKQIDVKENGMRDYLRVMYYRLISAAITILHGRGENLNNQLELQFFDENVCRDIFVFQKWSEALVDHIVPSLTQKEIPDLILSVKKYICDNIDCNLTRESIANEAHISPSYLSRLFHKETGEKLSDYILKKRIERAREMLENTDEKITTISQKIGYSNDSYFIKIFKAITGLTPYEYRKMCREKERVGKWMDGRLE